MFSLENGQQIILYIVAQLCCKARLIVVVSPISGSLVAEGFLELLRRKDLPTDEVFHCIPMSQACELRDARKRG